MDLSTISKYASYSIHKPLLLSRWHISHFTRTSSKYVIRFALFTIRFYYSASFFSLLKRDDIIFSFSCDLFVMHQGRSVSSNRATRGRIVKKANKVNKPYNNILFSFESLSQSIFRQHPHQKREGRKWLTFRGFDYFSSIPYLARHPLWVLWSVNL